ncbi:hypothetical protein Avbf_08038 [Armadillidium vulgare]|nr:hypothetical protein Avbf_08038 [Armadillidium vulgare]
MNNYFLSMRFEIFYNTQINIYICKSSTKDDISQSSVPFKTSFFSFSYFIHLIWFAMQISGSSFYSMYFNSWISNISETNEMGNWAFFFVIWFNFIWLLLNISTTRTSHGLSSKKGRKSIEERLIQELKSPSLTLVFVTFVNIGTLSCLFFEIYFSVYLSLAGRAVLRSSMVAVGSSFLRLRFPAEHFDRLNGICGTSAAFFLFLQYPFFRYVVSYYPNGYNFSPSFASVVNKRTEERS